MQTRSVRRLISGLILLIAATEHAQDDALPDGAGPSGREIYQRVIDNKLERAYFEHRMSSTNEPLTSPMLNTPKSRLTLRGTVLGGACLFPALPANVHDPFMAVASAAAVV